MDKVACTPDTSSQAPKIARFDSAAEALMCDINLRDMYEANQRLKKQSKNCAHLPTCIIEDDFFAC